MPTVDDLARQVGWLTERTEQLEHRLDLAHRRINTLSTWQHELAMRLDTWEDDGEHPAAAS
jgi:hypothetical protein